MPSDFELTLTSHELFALPAGTPATGPAFRVEVTPRDRTPFFAVARLVRVDTNQDNRDHYCAFFRDEQRPQEDIFSSSVFATDKKPSELTPNEVVDALNRAIKSRFLIRYWKSPQLTYGLALYEKFGRIITQGNNDLLGPINDFCWRNSADSPLFGGPAQELHAFCGRFANDPSSELNFFFEWQKLSPSEKDAFITRCEWGTWEHLLHLLAFALQVTTYVYGSYPDEGETSSYWQFTTPNNHHKFPAGVFLLRWQKTICDIIRPAFWPHEAALCCGKWRHRTSNIANEITCSPPTAHEFLEAQLGLREFLRPYLSAGEIEALFIP